jgi:phosphoribosylaminoimidazole-succinocarboxamide synthase
MSVVVQSDLPGIPVKRGKVRDVYDLGNQLLFVATDRISAFDYVLPTGIPRKGEILTRMSEFWFDYLDVNHHFLTHDLSGLSLPAGVDLSQLAGRCMVVKKTKVIPIECVVRGYLAGSGWKEYADRGTVCAVKLPAGLRESSQLPEPLFTPATKAEEGHDENISFEKMVDLVGADLSSQLRNLSLDIYSQGARLARERGIILADTKFEFGLLDGNILLIDEVMTPDSSRFWPHSEYAPGRGQPSFDKQYVRDWLSHSGWDRNSQPPELPNEVVERTTARYIEAFERLTGTTF